MNKTLSIFNETMKKVKALNYAISLIHWDLETEAPENSIKYTGEVLGNLNGEVHKLITSKKFIETIEKLQSIKEELAEIDRKRVEEMKIEIKKIVNIPIEEYIEYNTLISDSHSIWANAKEKNSYEDFLPTLKKIIEFNRKFILYRENKEHPYDVLLNDYEPGMTVKKLDVFFENLKKEIIPLLKQIVDKKDKVNNLLLGKAYNVENQEKFCKFLGKYLGFNYKSGVLKKSVHPFTLQFEKNNVRITTKYDENYLQSSIFALIHEVGHALYEQNISDGYTHTVLGEGTSTAIHESQSRYYENIIGRDIEFWKPIYKKLVKEFENELKDITVKEFYKSINKVEPSYIRIEADELTYSLHIMIRYEIEKMVFEDKIEAEEIPNIWNKKMKEYLGLSVRNDREGALQDVHWSSGLFGYFPSYALGSAYASQIDYYLKKEVNFKLSLKSGNINEITDYLRENIHKYGKSKKPNEIIKSVSGEDFNPTYYVEYLKSKYKKIYDLS